MSLVFVLFGYFSITLHNIKDKWKLKTVTLNTCENRKLQLKTQVKTENNNFKHKGKQKTVILNTSENRKQQL